MTVLDGRQFKAARAVLGMTVREMAQVSGLNRNTVLRVEAQKTLPCPSFAVDRLTIALRERGISFSATGDGERVGILFKAHVRRRPQA